MRFGSAAFVASNLASFKKRPQKPIELYEYEGGLSCVCFLSAASKAEWAAQNLNTAFLNLPPATSNTRGLCIHAFLAPASHNHYDELMPLRPAPGWPVPESCNEKCVAAVGS